MRSVIPRLEDLEPNASWVRKGLVAQGCRLASVRRLLVAGSPFLHCTLWRRTTVSRGPAPGRWAGPTAAAAETWKDQCDRSLSFGPGMWLFVCESPSNISFSHAWWRSWAWSGVCGGGIATPRDLESWSGWAFGKRQAGVLPPPSHRGLPQWVGEEVTLGEPWEAGAAAWEVLGVCRLRRGVKETPWPKGGGKHKVRIVSPLLYSSRFHNPSHFTTLASNLLSSLFEVFTAITVLPPPQSLPVVHMLSSCLSWIFIDKLWYCRKKHQHGNCHHDCHQLHTKVFPTCRPTELPWGSGCMNSIQRLPLTHRGSFHSMQLGQWNASPSSCLLALFSFVQHQHHCWCWSKGSLITIQRICMSHIGVL